MVTSTMADCSLALATSAPLSDLHHWWETRQADPDCAIAFADNGPTNFAEFLEHVNTGVYLLYLTYRDDGSLVGGIWLHDQLYRDDGRPHTGWLGAYVLPGYRHSGVATTMWLHAWEQFQEHGVEHVYAGVHHANYRSQGYSTRHIGLHLVGLYPDFTLFGGQWTDCYIYTLHPEDAAAGWHAAVARATQLRQERGCLRQSA